jgi:acyl-CoA synthetase (NDP forming)
MFGLGGIFVEILKDVALRIAPIAREEAVRMIQGVRGYPLLTGARGRPPLAVAAAAAAAAALSRFAAAHPELAELEANPLLVTTDAAVALDARLVRARPPAPASDHDPERSSNGG